MTARPLRARSRAARLAGAVTLVVVSLAGCSEQETQRAVDQAADEVSSAVDQADLPDVQWEKYGDQVRDRLDGLVDRADCSGLEQELAKAEGNDAELTRYIKAALRELDC